MKIALKHRLALRWDRIRNRDRAPSQFMAINRSGSGVSSIMVILPENPEHTRIAGHFLKSIMTTQTQMIYIGHQSIIDRYPNPIKENLHLYMKEDLTPMGYFKEIWQDTVLRNISLDAFVDLNPEFNLAAAGLSRRSKAPLRIGFYSLPAEEFYNVLIDLKGTDFLEKGYINIQKILGL